MIKYKQLNKNDIVESVNISNVLFEIYKDTCEFISENINWKISEHDILQFILGKYNDYDLVSKKIPRIAFNENNAISSYIPNINNSKEVIELIIKAIEKVGLKLNKDILISLDVASTEFYKNNYYHLNGEGKKLSSDQMINYLKDLVSAYPIFSIEDGMAEDDWEGWVNLTKELGKNIQLVGDDLFVTNIKRLKLGIEKNAGNSILVKLNQIGTLSETLETIYLAKQNKFSTIISHRSGETEDTTIADLSVAVSSGQIKTGSLSRTDRTSKYNQLLRIEEYLGVKSKYAGNNLRKD